MSQTKMCRHLVESPEKSHVGYRDTTGDPAFACINCWTEKEVNRLIQSGQGVVEIVDNLWYSDDRARNLILYNLLRFVPKYFNLARHTEGIQWAKLSKGTKIAAVSRHEANAKRAEEKKAAQKRIERQFAIAHEKGLVGR